MLRDLICHMLQKTPFVTRDCLYEARQDLECLPKEYHKISNSIQDTLSSRGLSIMSCKVKELPPRLLNAPKLQVMILRDNAIQAIPVGFFCGNFRNLRVLDPSDTKISSLPISVKNLKQLVVLNLCRSCVRNCHPVLWRPWPTYRCLMWASVVWSISQAPSLCWASYNTCMLTVTGNDMWKEGGWLRNSLHTRASLTDLMKLVLLR